MSKKFRCGRLLLTQDGRVKKLDLGNGGGTRTCDWTDDRMTFDDVHKQLLAVFSLTNNKGHTSLYDFQHRPLDLQQFQTLADYINKYGLNRNSTVVYLCTSETDDRISSPAVKNEPVAFSEETLSALSKSSSTEYSFIDASNDLMKHIRELIKQSPSEKVLTQLFDNLCLIQGYVFSIIVPLQQQLNAPSNDSAVTLYLHNLDNVYEIFDSTKALLHANIERFRHLKLFGTLRSAFFQFHNNVKIIRSRSMETTKSDTPLIPLSDTESEGNTNCQRMSTPSSLSASAKKETREKDELFRPLVCLFYRLLGHLTQYKSFPTFREFVLNALSRVKQLRTDINLLDKSSIYAGKRMLSTLRKEFYQKFGEAGIRASKVTRGRKFDGWCDKTRIQLTRLLQSLRRYEAKIDRRK